MFERFSLFLKQFTSQSQTFFGGLSQGRKIALLALIGAVIVGMLMTLSFSRSTNYEQGFSNLSAEDKTAILAHFKKNNVTDFKVEGDSIYFPEARALERKMELAQENLPNSGVGIGWEKFDEQSFATTDFQQRINKLRALQGELSRTVNKLEPVESSRVHIVIPDPAVFAEDKVPTTASISLNLKRGKQLSQRQIQGVLHLVAGAVGGLQVQNITIVDSEGNMLTKPDEGFDSFEKVNSAQREYQKKYEREQEIKIKDILARVVGDNKVIAKVDADMDFKKVETTINDVDPERTAVLMSNRNEQSSNGSGLNPTGVPGAKSNLPGERDDIALAGGAQNQSKQNTETINYEIKKTFSKIIEPTSNVKKLSVAVLVDGKMVDGKYVARTAEEIAMITKLTKNAIGFQDSRDSLTVENAQFELDAYAKAEQAVLTDKKSSLIQTGIYAAAGLFGLVFLFFGVLRPYFRWLTFDPTKRKEDQFSVVNLELDRTPEKAKRIQIQEDLPFDKLSPKDQVMYLAKNDPKKTTEGLRQLLSPNHQ